MDRVLHTLQPRGGVGDGAVDHGNGALEGVAGTAGLVDLDVELTVSLEESRVGAQRILGATGAGVGQGGLRLLHGGGKGGAVDLRVAGGVFGGLGDLTVDLVDEGLQVGLGLTQLDLSAVPEEPIARPKDETGSCGIWILQCCSACFRPTSALASMLETTVA